ncbi:MAG: hypothetical protein Q9193_001027 [Seirophora villosa]
MAPYNFKTTAEEVAADYGDIIRGKIVRHSPKLLILAGRNLGKCEETAKAIKSASPGVSSRLLKLDPGSLEQTRKAAAEVNGYPESVDVSCNNAGVMASPYTLTKDGLETQFAVNHIGHFLFTNLIMPKLLASSGGARIVSVSSDGHRLGPVRFDDWNWDDGKTYDRWRPYGQGKSANMLFALALSKRLGNKQDGQGILAVSVHPGVMGSNLVRHIGEEEFNALGKMDRDLGYTDYWGGFESLRKNASEGAATHVYAAFDSSLKHHNGAYLVDSQVWPVEKVRPWARDPVEAEEA